MKCPECNEELGKGNVTKGRIIRIEEIGADFIEIEVTCHKCNVAFFTRITPVDLVKKE